MKVTKTARSSEQRKHDVLSLLDRETDVWVATADGAGLPGVAPLRFVRHADTVGLRPARGQPVVRLLPDPAVRGARRARGSTSCAAGV
ncbi:hypothetical protein OHB00_47785 [Streptomyces sp. NBC_00631]|uniref:hypothetical protein n=1 Tax=Streptomyces sp. NBC_00631 TaxID=2975793 RepID=UPI0030E4DE2A